MKDNKLRQRAINACCAQYILKPPRSHIAINPILAQRHNHLSSDAALPSAPQPGAVDLAGCIEARDDARCGGEGVVVREDEEVPEVQGDGAHAEDNGVGTGGGDGHVGEREVVEEGWGLERACGVNQVHLICLR